MPSHITSRLSTLRAVGPPPDRFSVALQTGRLAQRYVVLTMLQFRDLNHV